MPSRAEYDVFVSYARADNVPLVNGEESGWITTLCRYIGEEHARTSTEPLHLFLDREAIRSMEDWKNRLHDGLRTARVLLAIATPQYFQSKYCQLEFETHRQHQVHRQLGQQTIVTIRCAEPFELNSADAAWREALQGVQSNANATRWLRRDPPMIEQSELRSMASDLYEAMWPRIQSARQARRAPTNIIPPTPHFIGRSSELHDLHQRLAFRDIGVTVCLQGLGGQGKSQLAAAYAFGFSEEYACGAWLVNATGASSLLPLMGALASDLGLERLDSDENPEAQGRRVLAALRSRADAASVGRVIVSLDAC